MRATGMSIHGHPRSHPTVLCGDRDIRATMCSSHGHPNSHPTAATGRLLGRGGAMGRGRGRSRLVGRDGGYTDAAV